jgi:hypothetical protein
MSALRENLGADDNFNQEAIKRVATMAGCVALRVIKEDAVALEGRIDKNTSSNLAKFTIDAFKGSPNSVGSFVRNIISINANDLVSTEDFDSSAQQVAKPDTAAEAVSYGKKDLIVIDNVNRLFKHSYDPSVNHAMAGFVAGITQSVNGNLSRLLVASDETLSSSQCLSQEYSDFDDFTALFSGERSRFTPQCQLRDTLRQRDRDVDDLQAILAEFSLSKRAQELGLCDY